ncbi:MAG: hypothetical protein ABIJ65_09975 [Chloroflexota bacterium]
MTSSRRFTLEQTLFSLAFFLALVLRFINLGAQPLTDLEAKWALQAAEIARGSKPLLGGQPAYLLLTAVNFFIFGTSNFMARFWPALVGSGLVLVPVAFQKQLGRTAAILLAFALALDPGMLAFSRSVESQMMAVGFMGLCLAAWQSRKYKLAGSLGGVTLLCGSATWFGSFGLGLSWLIINYAGKRKKIETSRKDEELVDDHESIPTLSENNLRTSLVWGAGTLLLVGTMLFLVPNGLNAWAGSIADFITGWWSPVRLPLWRFPVTLLVYAPLALTLSVISLVRGILKRDKTIIKLGILTAVYFLLVLSYTARQTKDLVWMLLPVWSLAVIELDRQLEFDPAKKWEIILASVIMLAFMVYIWLDLISLSSGFNDPTIFRSRIILMLGALLIFILSMFLLAAIWDEKIVFRGLFWGWTLALLLFTISAAFNASGLRQAFSTELWQPAPQFIQADLLEKTVKDLSVWRRGQTKRLMVTTITDLNSPALLWLLRDWQVDVVDALPLDASPDLVILPKGIEMRISSAYRGQDFLIRKTPIWDGLPLDGWLRWIAYRKIPDQSDFVVLWAREDLFQVAGAGLDPSIP